MREQHRPRPPRRRPSWRRAPDHRYLFELAAEQGGYFTAAQAHQAGFATDVIRYHVRRGRFRPVQPKVGVYRLRDFPTGPDDPLWAAWMRLGPKAVLSHGSALRLHNLSDVVPDAIDMWVPYAKRPRMRRSVPNGVRIHVTRRWLAPRDVTRVNGLPVTSPARTLLDVTDGSVTPEQIVLAMRQAMERGLVTPASLRQRARARGANMVRRVEQFLHEAAA